MKVTDFYTKKAKGEKITMVTCYDYTCARIVANTEVDTVLVGDSVSMVMHGHPDTTYATVEMMAMHTQAVSRGLNKEQFIVADLPFMSYRSSQERLIDAVTRLIQSGAHAVKLEGVDGNLDSIEHLVNSGVPVMGHIGLTPQFINVLGGYKVQGRSESEAETLLSQAKKLQEAGCFALVLECVPSEVATRITEALDIPTIGIGAGHKTDGQVLVLQDLLGMNQDFKPKFVKQYLKGHQLIEQAINEYCDEVSQQVFPDQSTSFANLKPRKPQLVAS